MLFTRLNVNPFLLVEKKNKKNLPPGGPPRSVSLELVTTSSRVLYMHGIVIKFMYP